MGPLQTTFANTASNVAMTLNLPLKKLRVGPGDYVPEIMAPEEQLTGGGVRGLQRFRLVPLRAGHPTLVIGTLNLKNKTADLRSFLYVDTTYRKWFKKAVPLNREEYGRLLAELDVLLRGISVTCTMSDTPSFEANELAVAPPGKKSHALWWVLLAIACAVAGVLMWLRRGG